MQEGGLLRAIRLASPHRPLHVVRLRITVTTGTVVCWIKLAWVMSNLAGTGIEMAATYALWPKSITPHHTFPGAMF